MDAYTNYIMTISKARTAELRQEAAEYALSAGARRRRRQRWAEGLHLLLRRRRMPAPRSAGRSGPAPALGSEGRSGPAPQSLSPQAWASNSSPSAR
jgi:hypothetical protein